MKKYFKILIVCMLILLGTTAVVSAYWTDVINPKINLTVTYDSKIKVVNVPENKNESIQENERIGL